MPVSVKFAVFLKFYNFQSHACRVPTVHNQNFKRLLLVTGLFNWWLVLQSNYIVYIFKTELNLGLNLKPIAKFENRPHKLTFKF